MPNITLDPKFEAFAKKYNYNADGRKLLKTLETLWTATTALVLIVGVWVSIWAVCIATGFGI